MDRPFNIWPNMLSRFRSQLTEKSERKKRNILKSWKTRPPKLIVLVTYANSVSHTPFLLQPSPRPSNGPSLKCLPESCETEREDPDTEQCLKEPGLGQEPGTWLWLGRTWASHYLGNVFAVVRNTQLFRHHQDALYQKIPSLVLKALPMRFWRIIKCERHCRNCSPVGQWLTITRNRFSLAATIHMLREPPDTQEAFPKPQELGPSAPHTHTGDKWLTDWHLSSASQAPSPHNMAQTLFRRREYSGMPEKCH